MTTRPHRSTLSANYSTTRAVGRRGFLSGAALLGAGVVASPLLSACSKSGTGTGTAAGADIGKPTTAFPSKLWTPGTTAGSKPDLPKRIAFQNVVSGAAPLELTDQWLNQAADDISFEYITANSQGNSAATITQMNQSIARGVMGMVAPAQDIPAQVAAMQANMDKGGAMFLFNAGGITCGMAAVQYNFGHTQGTFAAKYIKDELGGDAKVLFINANGSITLRPRETGFFDGMKEGGIDTSTITSVDAGEIATQDKGFEITNTELQKSGSYDVVVGAQDELALGAMAALKSAGMFTSVPKLAVIGAEGSPQAVDYIKQGNTPFKATSAVHFPMVGYVPGRMIGRWADGLDIPQYLEYMSFLIDSKETATAFEADLDRCSELYDDFMEGDTQYVTPRGSISFDTRNSYYEGDLPEKLPEVQA